LIQDLIRASKIIVAARVLMRIDTGVKKSKKWLGIAIENSTAAGNISLKVEISRFWAAFRIESANNGEPETFF